MKVLVTGGNGFVGSHIVNELVERGHDVVSLSRRGSSPHPGVPGIALDLSGGSGPQVEADVFLHCAAYVGPDEKLAQDVNVDGTSRLLESAHKAGARFLFLSTLSVYGSGPHSGWSEGIHEVSPESATSRSKACAEKLTLEAGGSVFRTALTFGVGDRWLIPAVATVASLLGVPPELRDIRTSVVSTVAVARALAGFVDSGSCRETLPLHLAHPTPVNLFSLAEELSGRSWTESSLADFQDRAKLLGYSQHQLNLLSLDHWYASERVWKVTGEKPGPVLPFMPQLEEWYGGICA